MRTHGHNYTLAALGLIVLMLTPICVLSKGLFDNETSQVLPFDEGEEETIPAAVASISLVECEGTHKGVLFTFGIDVFESAWEPVYAIRIVGVGSATIEAVDWPVGWSALDYPLGEGFSPGSVSFYTDSNPIVPGASAYGFTVLSNSNSAAIRWFATDKTGVLLGKVTRTLLECPTAAESATWGAVKAVYR